ncbi:hypothetical protein ACFLXA_04305 [Chloroflexota bacterium]
MLVCISIRSTSLCLRGRCYIPLNYEDYLRLSFFIKRSFSARHGFEKGYLWKIRHVAPASIAEVPGTVRKHRPGIQPPGVENFFLAGDTLQETRPTGVQAAACCVLQCVDKILGNKNT